LPLSAPRRILLLGFMASGKTAVGRALAAKLGWEHVDLDAEIEREAGASVQEIFAERGEEGFRALEVRVTPAVLAADRRVVTPGGGWVTNRGLLETVPEGTLTAWLRVSPSEVVRRLAADPAQPVRPLLQGSEGERRLRELLAAREPLYRRAMISIETDGRTVEEIVAELMATIHQPETPPRQPEQGR
jgi:shikimate kinase